MYMLYMYEPGKHRTCSISLQVRICNTCSWLFQGGFPIMAFHQDFWWFLQKKSYMYKFPFKSSSTVLIPSNTHKLFCATKPFNRHPAEVLPEERSPRSSLRSSISSTASAARQAFPGSVFDLIAVTVLSSCACPPGMDTKTPKINDNSWWLNDNPPFLVLE